MYLSSFPNVVVTTNLVAGCQDRHVIARYILGLEENGAKKLEGWCLCIGDGLPKSAALLQGVKVRDKVNMEYWIVSRCDQA